MLLYRKEHLPDGQEFINHYTNYVYEDLLRTIAVIDIPVSSQQDCSKHIVRLISLFFADQIEKLQFQLADGAIKSYDGSGYEDVQEWLNDTMIYIGTLTWRKVFDRVENEDDVRV